MKSLILLFTLVFSSLSFAGTQFYETDESCEIDASFVKFDNSSTIFLQIKSVEQTTRRRLDLEIMNDIREIFRTTDDQLPSLVVRMTFDYENSLPLLSVYYSGRYFSCDLRTRINDQVSMNVGSIGH